MNKVVGIGIVGILSFAAYKLIGMKTLSDKLVSELSNPRLAKLDWNGLYFRTEVNIKNPTQKSITITKPVVTVTTNGKYITSSNPEQKKIVITPLAVTKIDTIELLVPLSVLSGYISDIITKIPELISKTAGKKKISVASVLSIPIEMSYSLYANNIYFESIPQKVL